jgi:electron transfer flavoprotein-quinone oxidoreductase
MAKFYDVVIVGAGPAGSMAALKLARAGLNVCMLERGRYPGSKNMFGGLLHNTPVLNEMLSDFTEKAPLERHVYKKVLTFITPDSSLSLDFENEDFDRFPYNGFTVFRPVFDKWLADRAVEAGATLYCDCTAEDFVRKNGQITGVTVRGRQGELRGNVVIAADGVLSFMAEKAGLRRELRPRDMGVGIKLLLGMPENMINERFHLARDEGADISFVGSTEGIRGGSFLYTNTETVSIGMVLHLDSLKTSGRAPYEVMDGLLRHPQVRKLVRGAELLEYSAHLVPEGGIKAVPQLYTDGMMVAGDAAGLCYTNGINLEGINLAMTSGVLAAETAIEAIAAGDYSARRLASYKKKLYDSFVIRDMKTFKNAVGMMHMERLFEAYPQLLTGIFEKLYRVDGSPRPGLFRLTRREVMKIIGLRRLVSDGIRIGRALL